ncbi:prolyl oligopeptidase family serine peptidase [Aquabacterium humicola]|uniref:prolyl oligopeptidase family serine peptidase n=1 Tax=Aquabacterium humicola TaxID=3237377 RepID=UPI0025438C20|nr:prolyl oligopeptidase family serine peptidase [Rubrivivax pictus]
MSPVSAACGTWPSPISAACVAAGSKPLSSLRVEGTSIHWLQGLPEEGGRVAALVSTPAESLPRRLTAASLNVRTRVHEYGEGAYALAGEVLYLSNFADNLVYRQGADGVARAITSDRLQRYADFELDAARRRLIAVREDHRDASQEPRNSLVAIGLDGATEPVELAAGHDFYAAPRLSPDGRQLAWLAWNHPSMPFFDTELWLADVAADGTLVAPRRLAGGIGESLAQPEWSPDGHLFVVSDRSGWWNLYRVTAPKALEALCPMDAEFAHPQWVFARNMFGFNGADEIIATCIEQGVSRLGRIEVATGRWTPMPCACTDIDELRIGPGFIALIGGSPTMPRQVLRIDLADGASTVLARSVDELPDAAWLAAAQPIAFPSARGRSAHAFYYAPTNPGFVPLAGERPPLVVTSHGGPTSSTNTSLRLNVNFWTSRGFALVDVNYGGSTGHGRAYRELLNQAWGIVDVEDCVAAARHLAAQGLVDAQRMAIRGASASGFTTLCALIFHDVFKAGASYFGVSDLAGLDADTHKFESRYTTSLVPRADYAARSPLAHADRLNAPVIFFQGLDDKVVTPAQSESMVAAMKRRGVPVEYHAFEGEGHGFRKAATIEACMEAELAFYGRVFGFDPHA